MIFKFNQGLLTPSDAIRLECILLPQDMTLKEAEILCLRVLKQVMEEKLDQNNVQLATVTPRTAKDGRQSGQFSIMKEDQLQALIAEM